MNFNFNNLFMKSILLVGPFVFFFFPGVHCESAFKLLFKMYAESQGKVAENQRFFILLFSYSFMDFSVCLVIIFLQAFPS